MVKIDIPMYITKSKNEINNSKLEFNQGVKDLLKCKNITTKLDDWKDEMPWMSLYFIIAAWGVIILFIWYRKFIRNRNTN